MDREGQLRAHVRRLLTWEESHVGFDRVVRGIPGRLRGVTPSGHAHTAWQLVEHMRLAQADILEFCRARGYREKQWPSDYWPVTAVPSSPAEWSRSLAEYRAARAGLVRLAGNRKLDLLARVPHGSGQTYLRELLLVADHTAYHVGQLVLLRRALGIWPR